MSILWSTDIQLPLPALLYIHFCKKLATNMTKNIVKTTLVGLFVCLFTVIAAAQYSAELDFDKKKKKKKKKGDEKELKDHLWYGAGLNIGFQQFNNTSAFGFGLAPMVGYKIIPRVSVGPRVSLFYTAQKVPGIKTFNLLDTEISAFLRVHAVFGIFLQAEVGPAWQQFINVNNQGDLVRETQRVTNPLVGIGYNFSRGMGGPGQEVSLMYNFRIANDINTAQQPIQYRLAFTYGF
jgi:hypothetical protein